MDKILFDGFDTLNNPGVYMIVSEDKEIYIGATGDSFNERKKSHESRLREKKRHHCEKCKKHLMRGKN